MSDQQTCILILGMHRSGTSTLSGVLNILGVDLGNKLLLADEFNQKGFFENSDLMKINMEFLQSQNVDTDGIVGKLPFTWPYEESTKIFKEKIKELIKRDFANSKIFGFKDPRISILLPAYVEVLKEMNIKTFILISKRDIQNTVASLHNRGVVSLKNSIKAYKHYYMKIESSIDGLDYMYIQYEDVLNNSEQEIGKILSKINNSNLLSYEQVKTRIDKFLDKSLVHNNISLEDFLIDLADKKESLEKKLYLKENEINEIRSVREKDINILNAHSEFLLEAKKRLELFEEKNDSLKEKYAEYKHNNHLQHEHIQYLESLLRDRDSHILDLNSKLSGVERSTIWKIIKAWDIFISIFFPRGSFIRNQYEALIRIVQNFLNDILPHYLVKFFKRQSSVNNKNYNEIFWESFNKKINSTDILFINHEETRTGAPRIVFDIAEFMKKNHKVAMVSLAKGSMNLEFNQEFGPVIYPKDLYIDLNPIEQAKKILEIVKPKIVYGNSIGTHHFVAAAKELNIPTIFHVHELDIAIKVMFRGKARESFKDLADIFIAVSTPVYNFLVNELKCARDKVVLIHEFVDSEKIKNKSELIPEDKINIEIDKKNDEVIILGLGTFIYRKGADIFMKVAKKIKEKGLNCEFVWIGSRPFKEPFMAEFDAYSSYFKLIQEKTNPFPYIKHADIMALPSREDPFPLVVLEGMSLGKPAVVFKDGGGIHEAVKDSGVIVHDFNIDEFADALENLILNPEKRKDLGALAREYQLEYDTSVIIPRIQSVIDALMNKNEK